MDNLTILPPELFLRVVEFLLEPQQTLTAYQCICGKTSLGGFRDVVEPRTRRARWRDLCWPLRSSFK